jgi:hypothetical protein
LLFFKGSLFIFQKAIKSAFFLFRSIFYYKNIYENHPSKIVSMVFTLLSVTITSPAIYFMLISAKNQNNRTLINQLRESVAWVALGWNLIAQPVQSISFLFYPIDSLIVCRAIFTVRALFGQPAYFLTSAALIVR